MESPQGLMDTFTPEDSISLLDMKSLEIEILKTKKCIARFETHLSILRTEKQNRHLNLHNSNFGPYRRWGSHSSLYSKIEVGYIARPNTLTSVDEDSGDDEDCNGEDSKEMISLTYEKPGNQAYDVHEETDTETLQEIKEKKGFSDDDLATPGSIEPNDLKHRTKNAHNRPGFSDGDPATPGSIEPNGLKHRTKNKYNRPAIKIYSPESPTKPDSKNARLIRSNSDGSESSSGKKNVPIDRSLSDGSDVRIDSSCFRQNTIAKKDFYEDLHTLIKDRQLRDVQLKRNVGKLIYQESEVKNVTVLSVGDFGEVYKAIIQYGDSKKDLAVCRKTAVRSPEEKRKEVCNLLMLDIDPHENIMQFYGICLSMDGKLSFLLELCELGSLDKLHKNLNLIKWHMFSRIALDLFKGLSHLEKNNILHRDIACRNLLLTTSFRLKIADFGLSVRAPTGSYNNSPEDFVPWPWMPPEAFTKCISTHKSDVWAAGVTLWEILTKGKIPYSNDHGSWDYKPDVMVKHIGKGKIKLPDPEMPQRYSKESIEGKQWGDMVRWVRHCLVPKRKARPSAMDMTKILTTEIRSKLTKRVLHLAFDRGNMLGLSLAVDVNIEINRLYPWKSNNIFDFFNPGKTSLMHTGSRWASSRFVKQLVEIYGADVNITDSQGQTPLHVCRRVTVAEVLVKAKADVNARDKKGNVALEAALKQRKTDLAKYLIAKSGFDRLTLEGLRILGEEFKEHKNKVVELFKGRLPGGPWLNTASRIEYDNGLLRARLAVLSSPHQGSSSPHVSYKQAVIKASVDDALENYEGTLRKLKFQKSLTSP
mmetsp:Transcript_21263/g.33547  ORF Transcript_21263/g.33547 Transcript_21263/m.33547 type:complete len:816 (-) Transcript_21263:206-2653(-)